MCEHPRQLVYPGGDRVCLDCHARYAEGVGWQHPEGLRVDAVGPRSGRGPNRPMPRS
jgi:hypothetical protein